MYYQDVETMLRRTERLSIRARQGKEKKNLAPHRGFACPTVGWSALKKTAMLYRSIGSVRMLVVE